MKSIFQKNVLEEVIERIHSLDKTKNPLWGKMTVTQMVRHCILCEQYYQGTIKVKRSLAGRLHGQRAIKEILKDDTTSFDKNAPTKSVFIVNENLQDLESEKQHWILLIKNYETFKDNEFIHWFFGKITKNQLGQFIYKHCDHHLKQFGV